MPTKYPLVDVRIGVACSDVNVVETVVSNDSMLLSPRKFLKVESSKNFESSPAGLKANNRKGKRVLASPPLSHTPQAL